MDELNKSRGATFMDMSSCMRSLQAYGRYTCTSVYSHLLASQYLQWYVLFFRSATPNIPHVSHTWHLKASE